MSIASGLGNGSVWFFSAKAYVVLSSLATNETSNCRSFAEVVQPLDVADDVMEVTQMLPTDDARPRSGSPMDTTAPPAGPGYGGDGQYDHPQPDSEEVSGSPSLHPPTRAIYIRGFVRPLQPQQLQDHLTSKAGVATSRV